MASTSALIEPSDRHVDVTTVEDAFRNSPAKKRVNAPVRTRVHVLT
jgi:hypothetical protein